jgi:hypothetical protein
MQSLKYVGLDVHRDTVSVAVLDEEGKLAMQLILATQARFWILWAGCAGRFPSPSRKERTRPGCMICWCGE